MLTKPTRSSPTSLCGFCGVLNHSEFFSQFAVRQTAGDRKDAAETNQFHQSSPDMRRRPMLVRQDEADTIVIGGLNWAMPNDGALAGLICR